VLYREYVVTLKGLPEPHWDKHKISEITGLSPDCVKSHKGSFFLIMFHVDDVDKHRADIGGGFRKQVEENNKKVYNDSRFHRMNREKIVEYLKEDRKAFSNHYIKHIRKIFPKFWNDVKTQVRKELEASEE